MPRRYKRQIGRAGNTSDFLQPWKEVRGLVQDLIVPQMFQS